MNTGIPSAPREPRLAEISTVLEDLPVPSVTFTVVITRFGGSWVLVRVTGQDGWEFPGGKIDPGESPGDGAIRELYEETGIKRAELSLAGWYSVDRGGALSYGYIYLCTALEPPGVLPPGSEIAEASLHSELPDGPYRFPLIIPHLFEFAENAVF